MLGFGKAKFVGLDGAAEQNRVVDMNGYSESKTVERVIPVAKPAEQAQQTAMPQKKGNVLCTVWRKAGRWELLPEVR